MPAVYSQHIPNKRKHPGETNEVLRVLRTGVIEEVGSCWTVGQVLLL